jgi:hypothetical protein
VIDQIREMSWAWVLAAIALELGSCLSYVIVFRRFFPEPPAAVGRRGLAGVLLLAGVSDGPHDLLHAGGPILVSIAVLSLAALLAVGTRRVGEAAPRAVREIAAGLEGALRSVGAPHWRLLGTAGFLCLDMAALWPLAQRPATPSAFSRWRSPTASDI